MSRQLRAGACLAAAVLATAGSALAAAPIKGTVYAGRTAHSKVLITLTISKSGKTLKADVPDLPAYCQGGSGPVTQVTAPATISSSGSFSGTIAYQANGRTAFKGHFSGRFVKKKLAKGTLRSEYASKECSGTTTWSAEPAGAL